MSIGVDNTKENLFMSSVWGLVRGIGVNTFIYPLEVVKIRQQCSQGETKSFRIAKEVFQNEGIGAFYKGLAPQLLKISIKQIWCWPMMTGMPSVFRSYDIENLQQQALTGLVIATIDAGISNPLERWKIILAFSGNSHLRLKNVFRDGWKGFSTHWTKLSVNWSVFLTTQKYLRDQSHHASGDHLTLSQSIKIGTQVALIMSLVSAPLDIANTLRQASNLPPSQLFNRRGMMKLYRGWPLNALSLTINNIASVSLIDWIESNVDNRKV